MTKQETIQILQSIEDRAIDFPNMTECDWVAIAAAKRHLTEEPVSEDLEEAAKQYEEDAVFYAGRNISDFFKAGANWKGNHLWKSADGDELPEIDREVIVLVQDYPDDKDHLRVAFAHRPNKYTKVWNYDLGEEQIVEIERYDKGEWNIPNVKYWLDVELPKEIEL